MARKAGIKSIEDKISKTEQKIRKMQVGLEKAKSELDSLLQKKREYQIQTILDAIDVSGKSMEEMLRLIRL